MRKHKEFRNLEIGIMPKDWEIEKIGDVITLEYGKGLPERVRLEGIYPVIGSAGIVGYHHKALVKGPGLVIGRKGTIGAISRIKSDFWPIDTTYYVKTLVKNINLKWLFYALVKLNLPKLNLSDVVPGLKRELVYYLKLPIPPLPEQKKIAEILLTVDEAIEKVDEAIKKTQRLKRGLMQELLTKGIGHKEFKDTEIGRIPEEWSEIELLNVFRLSSGKSRPKEIYEKQTEEYPNPIYGGNGIIGYTNKFLTTIETIVIGRVGEYCGSIHKARKFSWVTDNALYSIEMKNININLDFLTYYLIYLNLNKFKKKSGQPLMTQTIVYSKKIPLPPLPEQKKIAEILSTVDSRMEMLRKRKGKIERIKKGLMNDLLTGRKRVKLDS